MQCGMTYNERRIERCHMDSQKDTLNLEVVSQKKFPKGNNIYIEVIKSQPDQA